MKNGENQLCLFFNTKLPIFYLFFIFGEGVGGLCLIFSPLIYTLLQT